ncbi:transporter substrate-binding domain-containing protein [Salinibacterium sp. dk2585]|uniref:transporter substrate-binding domain-containing protein n=1 Tax=unclassified Salinibacterium TaxID=2632331 RepID=UPI0011C24EE3|nr:MULTISPECIES: transporter substrate-binding domain-containing protein [unclassified Salinibacterium]QEE61772.1 transporter substrate-binding domain-containing protein [Salinibacterium sp. dk2585]TXK54673.1 transporter substrate-binding domain-containing protein [Salinibacterium sp. dk5596]
MSKLNAPRLAWAVVIAALLGLTGCDMTVPTDPDGTLKGITNGVLRVGATPNDDRVTIDEDGEPSGNDVELVEDFADSLGAEIEWVVGSEESLVRDLETGRIDLVIGGITDTTPWSNKAAVTRPYLEVTEPDGTTLKLVMLAPIGENAFLTELETFLTEHENRDEQ